MLRSSEALPRPRPARKPLRAMSSRHQGSILLPVGLLLIAITSIQSGASLAKTLFPAIGAQGAVTLRLVFAAMLLMAVFRPWRARFTTSALKSVAIYGLALGGMNLSFYMALRTVPLGVAVALEFTGPLVVALAGARRPMDFLWVALAVAGLVLLLPVGGLENGIDPLGAAYALGAGACWALYILFGQKAGATHGMQTSAYGALIAAALVMPFGILHAGTGLIDPAVLPVALVVAVLSTALPYSLEMMALTRLPTRTFGILMSVEPAMAALSGLVFMGEQLSGLQWLAIGAIISASAGTTLTARREAAPAPAPVQPATD